MSEQRKLATIMAVDVAGYSRAAEVDDRAAADNVSRVRAAIDEAIAPNGGRVFNTAGDGFMIEFPAAASGVTADQSLLALVQTWLGHWQLAADAVAQAERRGGSAGNFYRAPSAPCKRLRMRAATA